VSIDVRVIDAPTHTSKHCIEPLDQLVHFSSLGSSSLLHFFNFHNQLLDVFRLLTFILIDPRQLGNQLLNLLGLQDQVFGKLILCFFERLGGLRL